MAGKHKGEIRTVIERINGVYLECTPPYDSQINGVAERFMQEIALWERVFLFGTKIGDDLWAEAIHHGNWFRNRLPANIIIYRLPI